MFGDAVRANSASASAPSQKEDSLTRRAMKRYFSCGFLALWAEFHNLGKCRLLKTSTEYGFCIPRLLPFARIQHCDMVLLMGY